MSYSSHYSLSLLLLAAIALLACDEVRSEPTLGGSASSAGTKASEQTSPASTDLGGSNSRADNKPAPKAPLRPAEADKGVFSELDPKVQLAFPTWLAKRDVTVVDPPGDGSLFAYIDGTPVALAHAQMGGAKAIAGWAKNDVDQDGIPNALDILIGAKKTALNGAKYQGGYKGLDYPGGDVPRTEGVCTDMVIRAVRNAGIDLQKELHEDIEASPKSYPMVEKPDPNIDQRRVKTILPYFERHWQKLGTDPKADALAKDGAMWAPGDVVFMNTMRDERPDHVGIISDTLGKSGLPLVINNWSDGYHTQAMDLLKFVPVTHRFRVPSQKLEALGGLDEALKDYKISLPQKHKQVILVQTGSASSSRGTLRRFRRTEDGWQQVGELVDVRLGAAGLGEGRGLYDFDAGDLEAKKEGDKRSPAGVFGLGTAFGTVEKPYEGDWPWRSVDARDRWVDDPTSPHYNTWQRVGADGKEGDWKSAEKLAMYRLGLVVEHNTKDVKKGAGSAIFLHTFAVGEGATLGCTSTKQAALVELLGWLDLKDEPMLVQVAL
ncbi:DUF1287 domain-containing protein [Persicimonas caeni]|uniref:DUF1287 domain-containing protein n=1 Tax=Persicimonas caeni TaxID=2292766 RepID=A0A4Y6PTD3_PERCE|nr:DUF1287 domain-containing protein [Persicimonas caeni]QDG51493.1 DUF1287 domain-containing protein [Persicimonas caeni]QED32714.1 DUF1287 domain-containing protein [Persicimonas caeni]